MANEKALELFKDEAFVKQLGKAITAEDAQKLFESNGAEITMDELNAIRATVKQQAGEKLDADELDLVAGGALGFTKIAQTLLVQQQTQSGFYDKFDFSAWSW